MRVIVYGIGAIGGGIAARLALSGTEVIGIARGSMLEAIRAAGGLTLVTHRGMALAAFPVVADPAGIQWRDDDVVMLTMKSNDTAAALGALSGAGVHAQPIVCAQNGVANETMALRLFPNVYGVMIMMLAQYVDAGTVVALSAPRFGYFDVGRAPRGMDAGLDPLLAALDRAGFLSKARPDVMAWKYGKLRRNLLNIVGAALGPEARSGRWRDAMEREADDVFRAAGIAWTDPGDEPLAAQARPLSIPGIVRAGGSTTQSLTRGTGSIETDFLNGEIALLGRLHGVPTPVNAAFVRIAHRMTREGMAPGAFPPPELERLLAEG